MRYLQNFSLIRVWRTKLKDLRLFFLSLAYYASIFRVLHIVLLIEKLRPVVLCPWSLDVNVPFFSSSWSWRCWEEVIRRHSDRAADVCLPRWSVPGAVMKGCVEKWSHVSTINRRPYARYLNLRERKKKHWKLKWNIYHWSFLIVVIVGFFV